MTAVRERRTRRRMPPEAPPILLETARAGLIEARSRGHVAEVNADGTILRVVGDPAVVLPFRSTLKPFALVALVEAHGIEAFDLGAQELAVMAGYHSGEDVHVRTLQAVLRRAGIPQAHLVCPVEGIPLDALTAGRLARDGETPGAIRHPCSGQHVSCLLLAKLGGWRLDEYWQESHPVQAALRLAIGSALGTDVERLPRATSGCGLPTFAGSLGLLARAYAFLADPLAVGAADSRRAVVEPLRRIRDALLGAPALATGTRDRVEASLARAAPGRVIVLPGGPGLRAAAVVPGRREGVPDAGPSGLAVAIEDGDGRGIGGPSVLVEALAQVGLLDPAALRALARYLRPSERDPHGRVVVETVPRFELAPVGELIE